MNYFKSANILTSLSFVIIVIFKFNAFVTLSDGDVINDHAINFYQKSIFTFCKHIEVVNSMSQIYKNPIDFDNHKYLFEYYALNKLD